MQHLGDDSPGAHWHDQVTTAPQVVKLWREDLAHINPKAAESLADPAQYPNLFPNLDLALHAEQYQVQGLRATSHAVLQACFTGHDEGQTSCCYCGNQGPHGSITVGGVVISLAAIM